MITLPSQDKGFQTNGRSTVNGNLLSTFNADLYSNQGKIRLSGRGIINVNSDTESNLGVAVAFKNYADSGVGTQTYWAVAGARVFKGLTVPSGVFAQDATSGTPTTCSSDCSDMEVFNANLYVTTASNSVYYFTGSAWANFTAGSSDTNPHKLCAHNNRMYMQTQGSKIISWDTSNSVSTSGQNTIELANIGSAGGASSNWVTFIVSAQNRLFIGTNNLYGGKSRVYIWDGVSSTSLDKEIKIEANGALACIVHNDIPYVMDSNGYLLKYTGATFEEVARFPLLNHNRLLKSSQSSKNDRWIHPNGMTISRNKVNIFINNEVYDSAASIEQYVNSGVWEYDSDIGLYHKTSVSYSVREDTGVNQESDYGQMRLSRVGAVYDANNSSNLSVRDGSLLFGAQYFTSATATKYGIFYNNSSMFLPFSISATASFLGGNGFFAGSHSTNVSGNTGWIFTDYSSAAGETSMTLTSAWYLSSGVYLLTFSSGEVRWATFTRGSTAVTWTNPLTIIATASVTVRAPQWPKWGYVITPEMYSTEIESSWMQVYARYKKFLNSESKIIVKYRTVADVPEEATITWTSTSTFTSTYDLSLWVVGDEVQITRGKGGGKSAHITVISFSAGTYTVTLGDTFTNASGTASARFSKWQQLNHSPITVSDTKQFKQLALPPNSNDTKIQLKVCMLFTGDEELEQLIAVDKTEFSIQ